MTAADKKREIARALYVSDRNEEDIAGVMDISKRTVQNYKSRDASLGYDWDMLRAEKHMAKEPGRREHLYSDFVKYMHDTLKEIREDENMSASDKADKIVKISDAFSKMKGIARHEDPKAFVHGIIKHVVQVIGEGIRKRGDNAMLERFIEIIDDSSELLDVSV